MPQDLAAPHHTLQLRAGLHPLTVLQLSEPQLPVSQEQLRQKIQEAPKFFENAPVVIDLSTLAYQEPSPSLDFVGLKGILYQHRLIPVGVKHGTPKLHADALSAGFAILQDHLKIAKSLHEMPSDDPITLKAQSQAHTHAQSTSPQHTEANQKSKQKSETTGITGATLIRQDVRSGQQIHAQGDLIVIGNVSSGAELLAQGHVHVYGALRGRAHAGLNEQPGAQIFCQRLEAELIAIGTQYLISEEIEKPAWLKAVAISLAQGQWQFRLL